MICDGFGVHVLGRDGRLRYGRVVDVADDGLFVDMLCSNRRREFWSIDKCFSSEFLSGDVLAKHYAANYNSTVSVVVLVPETPCGPWIWVPGEISCHGGGVQYAFYEEVLVRWHDVLTGLPRTDVVPIDRIRCLQEGKGRCAVQKVEYTALHPRMQLGTFTRHSVQLDGQLRSLSTTEAQTLIQRWNTGILWYACRGIRLVDTVGDRLDYLLISGCVISDPIETLCLLNVVKGLQDEWTWMVKMMIRDDYSGLPPELWREVFSQLDTVSQTRLRFGCSTWNLLMDSPALSALIVLEGRCVPCKRFPCEHFHPVSSVALFKSLRPATRHVALVDGEGTMTTNDLLNMSDMLLYTAKHRPEIRLAALHLIGWQISFLVNRVTDHYGKESPCAQHNPARWFAETFYPDRVREHCRLQDFIKIFSSLPCESLRMVNCTVKWFCPFDDHGSRISVEGIALRLTFGASTLAMDQIGRFFQRSVCIFCWRAFDLFH